MKVDRKTTKYARRADQCFPFCPRGYRRIIWVSRHTFQIFNSSLVLLVLWLNSNHFPLSHFSLSIFSPSSLISFPLASLKSFPPIVLHLYLFTLSFASLSRSLSLRQQLRQWGHKDESVSTVEAMQSDTMKGLVIGLLTWRFTSSRLSTAPRSLLLPPLCFFFMHRHSLYLITWK